MSVLSFGELLIDFVALEMGVTVGDASGFVKAPGGAPANVAAAVARLGYPSAFMGQVGDDPFGRHLADVLAAENVDISGLTYSSEARTALAFVSNTADGDRSFMFYRHPSADMLMTTDDVDTSLIDACDVFHHGSITFIREPAASALRLALDHAISRDRFISYDPNLRLPLWDSAEAAKAGMLAGLDSVNLLKISDEELTFLTGGHDVAPLWRDRMQMICVTYGAKGAVAHLKNGTTFEHSGYSVKGDRHHRRRRRLRRRHAHRHPGKPSRLAGAPAADSRFRQRRRRHNLPRQGRHSLPAYDGSSPRLSSKSPEPQPNGVGAIGGQC